ncbi:MAG: hypothetical protein KGH49_01790 [Candidatus Micrarchaeota archaeon]|nr:hypothetical protein [Candidatus Micrarchaeota archaeon]
MVKITYVPNQELIVHDVIKLDKDEILRMNITPNGNMPVYWCDGILYAASGLPPTPEVISDQLKGKIHWSEVRFADMKKYTPLLSLNEEEYKATMNFKVIDTSIFGLHTDFVKWLKSHIK